MSRLRYPTIPPPGQPNPAQPQQAQLQQAAYPQQVQQQAYPQQQPQYTQPQTQYSQQQSPYLQQQPHQAQQQPQMQYQQQPAYQMTAPQAVTQPLVLTPPWKNPKIMNPDPSPNGIPRPPYFRTTMSMFPATRDTSISCGLPFGLIVYPGEVKDVPVIDMSQSSIPRCDNCLSYLSPFENVSSDGKSSKCPFCGNTNTHKELNGQNLNERFELKAPVYDIITPPAFSRGVAAEPNFAIVFDLSEAAMISGFTRQMIASVRLSLSLMNPKSNILFLTMTDEITAFDFRTDREHVVTDLSDPELPYGIARPIGEILEQANQYLDHLLTVSGTPGSNCYVDAIYAAAKAYNSKGSVIIVGSYGSPQAGENLVKPRKPLPPEKRALAEKEILKLPSDNSGKHFQDLAVDLSRGRFSVHLFTAAQTRGISVDLIQYAFPAACTGGEVHFYPELDQAALLSMHNELYKTLTREYYWNCQVKLRVTKGTDVRAVYANSITRNYTTAIPILPADGAISYEIIPKVDVSTYKDGVLLQLAVLWTTSDLSRMIRIFTFQIPTEKEVTNLHRSVDEGAMSVFLAKAATAMAFQEGNRFAADYITKTLSILRSKGAPLGTIPYAAHSLLTSRLLRINSIPDERVAAGIFLRGANIVDCLLYLYPRMFDLKDPEKGPLPLNAQSFTTPVMLIHMADRVVIWAAPNTDAADLADLFGIGDISEIPQTLPQSGGTLNQAANALIHECYTLSGRYLPIEIVPPGSQREAEVFADILVEESKESGKSFEIAMRTAGYIQ